MLETDLTESMMRALRFAEKNQGWLEAGRGTDLRGRVVQISARTIDGLISRGLAIRAFGSEGGVACWVTEYIVKEGV